mmetsp:Transcript_22893/g.47800  ORF Transcript_22893/g.47800 Transcript_22893/m.47800 type:complete len:161 (-) Transcript_22893:363-845(-)
MHSLSRVFESSFEILMHQRVPHQRVHLFDHIHHHHHHHHHHHIANSVTAFTRVGSAIQDVGSISLPSLAYFCIFWQIWSKEASYSTRFDTTDISSHLETLLACFTLLGGSLSAHSPFDGEGCTRIMGMAAFVAALHAALHGRVWYWFREGGEVSARSRVV